MTQTIQKNKKIATDPLFMEDQIQEIQITSRDTEATLEQYMKKVTIRPITPEMKEKILKMPQIYGAYLPGFEGDSAHIYAEAGAPEKKAIEEFRKIIKSG